MIKMRSSDILPCTLTYSHCMIATIERLHCIYFQEPEPLECYEILCYNVHMMNKNKNDTFTDPYVSHPTS